MLSDFGSPSMLHHHVGQTSLSARRATFDDDSLIDSRIPSPARFSPAPPTRVVTIHDQISSWFDAKVEWKKLVVAGISGLVFAIASLCATFVLGFSIWSPFQSISDSLSALFSIFGLLTTVFGGIVASVQSVIFLKFLYHPHHSRISLFNIDSNIAIAGFVALISSIVQSFICLQRSNIELDRFPSTLTWVSTVILPLVVVFGNDYSMAFSGKSTKTNMQQTLVSLLSFSGESVLMRSVYCALTIHIISTVLAVFTAFLGLEFSHLVSLFSLSTHLTDFVITFVQIFTVFALGKLVRDVVMEPMHFSLPPPFALHSPTPQQTRTLTNVLDSNNDLLRLFAFFDLRFVAWSDAKRRSEIFSLSQPGGHARNWGSVRSSCQRVLEQADTQIQMATARLQNADASLLDPMAAVLDADSDGEGNFDRSMLMMPQRMRKQLYSSAIRQRHRAALRPAPPMHTAKRSVATDLANHFPLFKSLSNLIAAAQAKDTISHYNTLLVTLAIDALGMLAVQSYSEDRFGVVQSDLAAVIGLLLQMLTNIDSYFRTCSSIRDHLVNDASLRAIDQKLQSSLHRITAEFGQHLREIGLSNAQLQALRSLCQADI